MSSRARGSLAGIVAALLTCTIAAPISDEARQLVALHAIFSRMQVSVDRGKKIDDGDKFFPDALAGMTVYRVLGKAMNKAEEWASGDVITGKLAIERQVRLELFPWPNEGDSGLLAVLQYDFPTANPPQSLPSIGLLVHLVRNGVTWAVSGQYLLETVHHHSLQGIRMMNLSGRGADELVVESNHGSAGTVATSLQVFDLSRGSFDELVATESRMQYMTDDRYTQTLDADRTRTSHGRQFCFIKTTLFERGKAFRPPRVTHPCYKRGEGVDSGEVTKRNKMLAPLR